MGCLQLPPPPPRPQNPSASQSSYVKSAGGRAISTYLFPEVETSRPSPSLPPVQYPPALLCMASPGSRVLPPPLAHTAVRVWLTGFDFSPFGFFGTPACAAPAQLESPTGAGSLAQTPRLHLCTRRALASLSPGLGQRLRAVRA